MKALTLCLPLLLLSYLTYGQDWHLQNPLPTSYSFESVHFPDRHTGYAVGHNGTIMKTTDGGFTWDPLPGIADQYLKSVYFTNSQTGYVLGNSTLIWKTTDGGNSWNTVYSITNSDRLNEIYFVDSVTGFAAGSDIIVKTINAGTSWTISLDGSLANSLSSVYFPDKNTGYASGGSGKMVKTTDSGNTWTLISSGNSNSGVYSRITFTDSLTGFVAGNIWNSRSCFIIKTINGGVSWDTILTFKTGFLSSISCTDNNNIIATGYKYSTDNAKYGILYRTKNGGLTWESISYQACGPLNCIRFSSHDTGYIVGVGGKIIRTVNGGDTWEEYASGATQDIYSMYFTDRFTGYGTGANSTILKTLDGGSNWSVSFSPAKGELQSIYFIDKEVGYIAGSHGIIVKTSDAGQTWSSVPGIDTNIWFRSIHFPDHYTGYAGGFKAGHDGGNFVLKSRDAGATWDTTANLNMLSAGIIYKVYFLDKFTGFVSGGMSFSQAIGGFITKTNDGGFTWERVFDDMDYPIHSIIFTAPDTGYAVGGGWYGYWLPWPHGIILKTINRGETWDTLTTTIDFPLYSVSFTDANTGFAAGGNGEILKTINAGRSWHPVPTCTKYHLNTICFSDTQTGYCGGKAGTIIQTINAGTGFPDGSVRNRKMIVFPNPGKNLVSVELSEALTDLQGTITVYGITGQTLIKRNMRGVKSILDIGSLPVGVYFVTFVSEEFTETAKLLKINL